MIDSDNLLSGLAEIRSLLNADGGDLDVVNVDASLGLVEFRLVLEDAHCRECVLPRAFLEQVSLRILDKSAANVAVVRIDDPREA